MKKHKHISLGIMLLSFITGFSQLMTEDQLKKEGYEFIDPFMLKLIVNTTEFDSVPDHFPMYPGGLTGLLQDYSKSVIYPTKARKRGYQGRFWLRYVIEKDGSISGAEVFDFGQSIHPILKEAAMAGLKGLRRWHPAFKNGKPVHVVFTQPVNFQLGD